MVYIKVQFILFHLAFFDTKTLVALRLKTGTKACSTLFHPHDNDGYILWGSRGWRSTRLEQAFVPPLFHFVLCKKEKMAITVGGVSVQAFWVKKAKISEKNEFWSQIAKKWNITPKNPKKRDFLLHWKCSW